MVIRLTKVELYLEFSSLRNFLILNIVDLFGVKRRVLACVSIQLVSVKEHLIED